MLSDAEQKGKAEGKAEGKVEGATQKSLEIARAMRAKGLDDATIMELIGLSAADLSKI
jgi:predicted transposase/invertase (TIGR01784 family)